MIKSLEIFEDNFAADHVVPATIVLLNLLPTLPERHRGVFELDTVFIVTRVTYRLLRSLKDPNAIEAAVRAILPELTSLYAKLQTINQVGYREGAGHKLVSEAAASEFEKTWRAEVRAASAASLEVESNLLNVLLIAKHDAASDEPTLEIPKIPSLTLAILRASQWESRSQTFGSRAVRRSSRLRWDALIEIFGNEDELRNRIDQLKKTNPEGEDELLNLVDRYLAGWRPTDFDDD